MHRSNGLKRILFSLSFLGILAFGEKSLALPLESGGPNDSNEMAIQIQAERVVTMIREAGIARRTFIQGSQGPMRNAGLSTSSDAATIVAEVRKLKQLVINFYFPESQAEERYQSRRAGAERNAKLVGWSAESDNFSRKAIITILNLPVWAILNIGGGMGGGPSLPPALKDHHLIATAVQITLAVLFYYIIKSRRDILDVKAFDQEYAEDLTRDTEKQVEKRLKKHGLEIAFVRWAVASLADNADLQKCEAGLNAMFDQAPENDGARVRVELDLGGTADGEAPTAAGAEARGAVGGK